MTAIAQRWRDFQEHCYSQQPLAPEQEREYRMLFYAGFNACQHHFGDMSREALSAEEMRINVAECFEEFERFCREYIAERQREQ